MPPSSLPPSWADRSLSLAGGQRKLLAGLFGCVAIYAGIRLAIDRRPITDPQPPRGDHWADLADRIDPNHADWAELAALPGLGEKRARAIVEHREAVHLRDPSAVAYRAPEDLYVVRGIAYAMVEQLKPYLRFPGKTPATQSSR